MALRMAKNIREGHKVGWLIARRLKMKKMCIQLPCLANGGEGLGRKGWLHYARVLEKRAHELRSKLHSVMRQRMKKQKDERGMRLARIMEPASEDGGDREGAALSTRVLRGRRGMGQWTVL